MTTNNFHFVLCDTDAVCFCKEDGSPFSKEEQVSLLEQLNSIYPEYINFEHDGVFSRLLCVKAKNYVMYDGEELEYKGSAFKSATKEKALASLLKEVVEALIFETDTPVNIYHKYIKEALNITDMSRWVVKKSVTKKLLNGTRTNETKVLDAVDTDTIREGDKLYLYYAIDGEIQVIAKGEPQFYKDGRPKMTENKILKQLHEFDGNYDKLHYIKRVYDTVSILKTVINMEEIPKYHLGKNKDLLEELCRS
jgi:DNA polymerase elongation subunit (family B)